MQKLETTDHFHIGMNMCYYGKPYATAKYDGNRFVLLEPSFIVVVARVVNVIIKPSDVIHCYTLSSSAKILKIG